MSDEACVCNHSLATHEVPEPRRCGVWKCKCDGYSTTWPQAPADFVGTLGHIGPLVVLKEDEEAPAESDDFINTHRTAAVEMSYEFVRMADAVDVLRLIVDHVPRGGRLRAWGHQHYDARMWFRVSHPKFQVVPEGQPLVRVQIFMREELGKPTISAAEWPWDPELAPDELAAQNKALDEDWPGRRQ